MIYLLLITEYPIMPATRSIIAEPLVTGISASFGWNMSAETYPPAEMATIAISIKILSSFSCMGDLASRFFKAYIVALALLMGSG